MYKLILVRHGQSDWNEKNLFTGWKDVGLTQKGLEEAKNAGQILEEEGFEFDVAYTSFLKRSISTLWSVLEELDQAWIPVKKSWRLNERHYGALQGLNKKETVKKFGEEQVFEWRRSFTTAPPEMTKDDKEHPLRDRRYKDLETPPSTESLKDCMDRFMPYWEEEIVPDIKADKQVLIVAHGNSLRALIKHVKDISDEDISRLNIPTGIPLFLTLDQDMKCIADRFLGDEEAAEEAASEVARQTQ